jgi:hypothetical protein
MNMCAQPVARFLSVRQAMYAKMLKPAATVAQAHWGT